VNAVGLKVAQLDEYEPDGWESETAGGVLFDFEHSLESSALDTVSYIDSSSYDVLVTRPTVHQAEPWRDGSDSDSKSAFIRKVLCHKSKNC